MARERPVETILSGPAASIIGSKALTKEQDAIIVDVGGTTTDIGILRGGHPRLDPEGATVGNWKTRVKAVDIFTSGVGGDSRIVIAGGKIHLTSLRVIPLCVASSTWPTIRPKLERLHGTISRWTPAYANLESTPQVIEFYTFNRMMAGTDGGPHQEKVLGLLKQEPRSIYELAEKMDIHPLSLNLDKMESLGMILRIGLTPTDILHAAGSYSEYDAEASQIGVEIQASNVGMETSQFITTVKEMVVEKIASEVLNKLIYEEAGETKLCNVAQFLVDNIIRNKGQRDFAAKATLNKPIIGIGAPVDAYLPGVAEIFNTRLILPVHSEIGNAAGAVSGNVMEVIEMLIKPKKGLGAMDNPPCTLYWMQEKRDFESLEEAIVYAKEEGGRLVTERAIAAGADRVELMVENSRKEAKLDRGWGSNILLEYNISLTAIGKPKLFFEASK